MHTTLASIHLFIFPCIYLPVYLPTSLYMYKFTVFLIISILIYRLHISIYLYSYVLYLSLYQYLIDYYMCTSFYVCIYLYHQGTGVWGGREVAGRLAAGVRSKGH